MSNRSPLPEQPDHSARYRLWLSGTILLLLATLTVAIIVVIISSARNEDQQQHFDSTLTAVWQSANEQLETATQAPTAAPVIEAGQFSLVPSEDSPSYTAAESCTVQVVTGQIRDLNGQPTDAFSIRIWGDYIRTFSLMTGELAGEAPGVWQLTLPENTSRRLWVQLEGGTRLLSPPVEVVFTANQCDQNQATVTFTQIAPLD